MYKAFKAIAHPIMGISTTVGVNPVPNLKANNEMRMGVYANTQLIIITKEQAMEFFGLVEAPIAVSSDLLDEVVSINKAAAAFK